jgi:hypothetical protein
MSVFQFRKRTPVHRASQLTEFAIHYAVSWRVMYSYYRLITLPRLSSYPSMQYSTRGTARTIVSVHVTFKMAFTFSVAAYANMVYVFGLCCSNAVHAEHSGVFRTAKYPQEECLLDATRLYEVPVRFSAFALQLSVKLIMMSMKKKTLST